MVDKIIFKGYKSFKETTELELKPITILFGKNSSGKSAVAKLPTLIETSLLGQFQEPLMYINNEVELGAEFRDLFYNRGLQEQIYFELFSSGNKMTVQITNSISIPFITGWDISANVISDSHSPTKITSVDIEKANPYPFNGLILNEYEKEIKNKFFLNTDYIGPFRLNPPRVFNLKGLTDFKRIGNKGENAYQILANDEELEAKVCKWFENSFDGWQLYVNRITPYYEIRIRRKDSQDLGVNIVDVGQGMSQALPIIVKAHMENKKPVINIIEQPELHLHPAAHGNLAELISNSASKTNKYLIETHSENFILRLRRLIAEGEIDKSFINIYWVNNDNDLDFSSMKKIEIEDNGEVNYWPPNIFTDSFEEVKALRRAQKSNKE